MTYFLIALGVLIYVYMGYELFDTYRCEVIGDGRLEGVKYDQKKGWVLGWYHYLFALGLALIWPLVFIFGIIVEVTHRRLK